MKPFLNILIPIQEIDTSIKPLMEPDAVEFTFETIGWTIVLGIFIIVFFIVFIKWLFAYKRNKYKREALKTIENLSINAPNFIEQIATQLKLVAMQSYGRETVAHLSGKEWIHFLQSKLKETQFEELESFLLERLYKNSKDSDLSNQFLTYSKKWIKSHA